MESMDGKKLKFKAIDDDFEMEGYIIGINVDDLGCVTLELYLEKPKEVVFQTVTKHHLNQKRIVVK